MWSRNGSPVDTSVRPRPSRSTLALSCVSLLFLVTWPFLLLKSHLYCVSVRAQALHLREPDTRLAERLEVVAVEAQDAHSLEERVHAKRRREPGRARRWQRVIRARCIVAQRYGRVGPDEDGSRVVHLCRETIGVGGDDEQVLWREIIGDVDRLVHSAGHDDAAVGLTDDRRPLQSHEQALELFFDPVGEVGGVRDQHAPGHGIVLQLRGEIGGDEIRSSSAIRHHAELRWTRDAIHADRPQTLILAQQYVVASSY